MCYSILTADSNWDIAVARPRQNSSTLPLPFAFAIMSNTVARLRSSGITLFQAFHIPCTGSKTSCAYKSTTKKFQHFIAFSRNHFFSFHTKSQQVLGVQVYIYIYIYIYPMSSEKSLLQEIECAFDEHLIYTFSRQQCPRNDECWHALSRS